MKDIKEGLQGNAEEIKKLLKELQIRILDMNNQEELNELLREYVDINEILACLCGIVCKSNDNVQHTVALKMEMIQQDTTH